MNTKEAIEKLKWLSEQIAPSPIKEAIEMVVEALERPLPTDEEINDAAHENYHFGNNEPIGSRYRALYETKLESYIDGATWMRDEIRGSLVVRRSEQLSCPRCRHTGIDTDKDGLNYCRGCSHYWRAT